MRKFYQCLALYRVSGIFLHPPGSGRSSEHARRRVQCRATARSCSTTNAARPATAGQLRAVALQPTSLWPAIACSHSLFAQKSDGHPHSLLWSMHHFTRGKPGGITSGQSDQEQDFSVSGIISHQFGCRMQDAGCKMQDAGCGTFLLLASCFLLPASCSLLPASL